MTEHDDQAVQAHFRRGLEARDLGDQETAAECFSLALALVKPEQRSRKAGLQALLGNICQSQGDYAKAAQLFRDSSLASPRSELASVGLFNALVRQGLTSEALREVLRFLSIHDSTNYHEVLTDGSWDALLPNERALVDEARQTLATYAAKRIPDAVSEHDRRQETEPDGVALHDLVVTILDAGSGPGTVKSDWTNQALKHRRAGELLDELGYLHLAIIATNHSLRIDKDDPKAWTQLGNLHRKAGDLSASKSAFKSASGLRATVPNAQKET